MKRVYRCTRCPDAPMSWKERCPICGARGKCIGTLKPLQQQIVGVPLKDLPYKREHMNPFNIFDRWRESRKWIPAWLDNTDPKTWAMHALITALIAFGSVGAVWIISWVIPFFDFGIHLRWGALAGAIGYTVREVLNILDLKKEQKPLKPVDHAMDVITPWLVFLFVA